MSLTRPVGHTLPGLNNYVFEKEINHGYFGRVYRAKEISTGLLWACKVVEIARLNARQKLNVLQEVAIMKRANHPNIVKFKEFIETPTHFVIVMELMRGGDLFERLEKQTTFLEEDARQLILQVAQAIKYLHENGIAHRDLKIENLMFYESEKNLLKLGDFGLAKSIGCQATKTPVGTKEYMAPEIVRGEFYSTTVDVWSLGCLLFILLFGTFPFYNDTDSKGNRLVDITDKIKRGYYTFPMEGEYENEPVSEIARDLVRKALVVDPAKRITIHQFLEHPWIKSISLNKAPLHTPSALRSSDGFVSMRDYFNFGIDTERFRIDEEVEVEDRIAQQKSDIQLTPVKTSKLIEKRQKKTKGNEDCACQVVDQATPMITSWT